MTTSDPKSRNGDTGTYLSHTHSDLGGRFATTEHQTITGVASPAPPPLPANSPWHGSDPVPTEPPLGFRIDAMSELESSTGISPVSPPVAKTPIAPPPGIRYVDQQLDAQDRKDRQELIKRQAQLKAAERKS
jgi:hypothetical protein